MAANMFVQIDGITGDATEQNHIGWIPVKSVSWSVERVVDMSDLGSTQRGYANVNFAKIAVTSEIHAASTEIMLLASNGLPKTIKVSQCRVTDDTQLAMEEYLLWTLEMGQVTKYEVSCSEDGVPEETWEMGYRTIECKHTLVNANSMAKGSEKEYAWNLETGKYK
jgi:type VI secretion system secreted protein Hcp